MGTLARREGVRVSEFLRCFAAINRPSVEPTIEMYRDIEVGRSMLYRACATADPFPDPYQAALAKMYCNEMSVRVTSEAIQIHGGYGFTDEYPVSRLYRGARYGSLGGGTTETLKELVGKRLMTNFPRDGFLGMGTF